MAEFVIGKFGFLIINFFLVLTKESKKSKKILEPMGLLKNVSPFGPTIQPAIGNICTNVLLKSIRNARNIRNVKKSGKE